MKNKILFWIYVFCFSQLTYATTCSNQSKSNKEVSNSISENFNELLLLDFNVSSFSPSKNTDVTVSSSTNLAAAGTISLTFKLILEASLAEGILEKP